MSVAFLHVGPVKTGSTFIQDLLWSNRDNLAIQGVLLPVQHPNEMWLAANDLQACEFIHFDMPEAQGAWSPVVDRVLQFDGPSVISHEVLGLSTDAHIARIVDSLPDAQLHVVVMARSLTAMLPGLWQEKVKMVDPDVSWPDFLESERNACSPWTDTSLIVHRWLRHIPPEHVHIVTVPGSGSGRRLLLSRFAEAISIDVSTWKIDSATSNEALDAVQIELLRRLNQVGALSLGVRAQRRLVNVALMPRIRPANNARRLRLPAEHRDWVEKESSRRLRVLRTSGAVIHGDLEELVPPADCWETTATSISDADLLHEALLLLASSHPDNEPGSLDFL